LANKLIIILRARVNSLTGEGSKQDSKSMSNMTLLQLQEGDVMAQHQKEAREHKIVVNLSNNSARGRVDLLTGEESNGLVCQHIPTRKRKSGQYCCLGVVSSALIAGRIAFTC